MTDSDTCNCCEGVTPLTPASLENPPGQAALAYRVGTHGRFKTTMQAALSNQPALSDLTTRDDDDPSIALIDAWATTLDVLTFYQQRIANEGYLRTATERLSILELARSIGYELRPGVAASTYLAFELETAPGAPDQVTLAIGTKAQTLPGPDEHPQLFETIEPLQARPAWYKLKAKTTTEFIPGLGARYVYLKGVTTQLKPGDSLLFIGHERESKASSEQWDFRLVTKVTPDNTTNSTRVEWAKGLGWSRSYGAVLPASQDLKVYALRQRAALFGANAPDWRSIPLNVKVNYLSPGGLAGEYFDNMDLTGSKLKRIDPGVNFSWGTGSPDPAIHPFNFSIRWTGFVKPEKSGVYTFFVSSDDGVRLWVDGNLIIDAWIDQSPTEYHGTATLAADQVYPITLEYYQHTGGTAIVLSWSPPGGAKAVIPANRLYPLIPDEWPNFFISGVSNSSDPVIYLDALYPAIVPNSWLVLVAPTYTEVYEVNAIAEDSRKNFGLTSKTSRVTLQGENLLEKFNNAIRETVVYAVNEKLDLAEMPNTLDITPGDNSIIIDKPVTNLGKGRTLIVAGLDPLNGKPVVEKVSLDHLDSSGTQLVFQSNLKNSYKRDSVEIYANVAAATHGETKTEVLGSGDAAQPFQKFVLKQTPALTYVASDQSPSGALSTLAVRINDVLWSEVPSLYGLMGRDRKYMTRLDDDGQVTVEFGDGQSGARLPSGIENVQAIYRVGTGLAGMVKANQISLLMTRPLGVKSVINPLAPAGAQDPESREQARQNAPLTVLTLDRVVSLQDFEDFARAFSGIGKAQAVWLWDGERRIVHITVAAAAGGAVPDNSPLRINLRNAIAAASDPTQHFLIDSYQPLTFQAIVKVKIDAAYLTDKVMAAITSAVTSAFAFEQRSFGQPVTASELIALVQRIEGVVYVDLDALMCVEQPAMQPPLIAQVAHWEGNVIKPAELLALSTSPNSLQVIPI